MKNLKIKNGLIVFTSLVCAFLILGFVINLKLLIQPTKELTEDKIDFKEYTEAVQNQYTSKFFLKNSFLNLNGFFARSTGRSSYNDVVLLKNGMITHGTSSKLDMNGLANGINSFNAHLKENDVDFLYVQLPMKIDVNNELVLSGSQSYANENSNQLLSLIDKNVSVIDMRDYIAKNADDIENYFYRTDHHWNSYGAFEAYGVILNYLSTKYPEKALDMSNADIKNWDITVYEDWFLGSHGKRVGKYYAGTDDLAVFTPKFKTSMSMYVTNHRRFTSGSFSDAVMVDSYLDKPNYFEENPYCVYIGGDYPLVHHKNSSVKNDLKVLIIKDSYTIPVQAFLSTVVSELDVLDPRHYKETTIAEYVEISKPDIVIMMINPSQFPEAKYQKFGINEAKIHIAQKNKVEVASYDTIKLSAGENDNYIYKSLANGLNKNQKYEVTIEDINFLSKDTKGASIALYDSDSKKIISSFTFDLEYCKENGFSWTFVTPDNSGNLHILLYCGTHGNTSTNSMECTSVKVYKYE